jgi:hypothetical protein
VYVYCFQIWFMIKLEFILFTFIHFLKLVEALLTMIWNNAKKGTLLHVKYIYISAPDKLITITVQNKRCKLRTPWPIHFKLRIVIGIDSLMVCILFGEISIFHSRVMGLYSSNCRRFFVCHAVNWELLGQFTSNFAQLLELIVLRSVYFLVKFQFFIPELWDFIHQIVGDFSYVTL